MIIFLNGAGSSGKTSIAKALQHLYDKPLLRIGIDNFFEMMPASYVVNGAFANEGFMFKQKIEDNSPSVEVITGKYGQKIVSLMPKVVKLLSENKLDLIVDEVILSDENLMHYVNELNDCQLYFIGVKCSLEAMEEREYLRGDRAIGLSRNQYNKVHSGVRNYDFEVDTTNKSSFTCAKEIIDFINTHPSPQGFKNMLSKF